MTPDQMKKLTKDTDVKSEKIRILFKAGVERADIARFLEISYQHAHNVLKRDGFLSRPASVAATKVELARLELGGKLTLPEDFLVSQGLEAGDILVCREENGGLLILSREAAAEVLRERAREHMPREAEMLEVLLGVGDQRVVKGKP